jgi:ribosome maturation factor RimP
MTREGNGVRSLLYFPESAMEKWIDDIKALAEEVLEGDPAFFLVDIWIKPIHNIRVYVDGDQGVTIEMCTRINRALYKKIEEKGWFPGGDFSLEVSSPGLDEPLRLHRQYRKNTGRMVEVLLTDGRKVEGKLVEVGESEIAVEETKGKNKKKELIMHRFPFDHIKTTKVQVLFKNPG